MSINQSPSSSISGRTLSRKVAFVDDDSDLLEAYAPILRDYFDVDTFSNADDFIKVVEKDKFRYDLILTDFNMPKKNGLDLLVAFSKLGGQCPAVVFSGYLDKETCLALNRHGAMRLLEKPTEINNLIQAMEDSIRVYQRKFKILKLKATLLRMEDVFRAGIVLSESLIDDSHHLTKSFLELEKMMEELMQNVNDIEEEETKEQTSLK